MKWKGRQATGVVRKDIRSFFSTSPASSTAKKPKLGTPLASCSVTITPATTARTPSPNTPAHPTNRPTANAVACKAGRSRKVEGGASDKSHPAMKRKINATGTPEKSKAQSAACPGAISVTDSPLDSAGVIFLGTSDGGAGSGGKNKENAIMLSSGVAGQEQLSAAQNRVPTAAAGAQGAGAASGTAVAMSGFFLVRNVREDNASGDGDNDGGRYQLPLWETVVGRDSVRDKAKVNSNKLRLGIPSSMEGISRDQATLKVMLSSNRVQVMNKNAALNPIRIQRWSGSAEIALSEAQRRGPNGREAPAKAVTLTLTAGQQGYLYPGDSLELDGWVQRGKSKYGYVLHPLPMGARRVAAGTPTSIGRRAGGMSPALTERRAPSPMEVLNTPPPGRAAAEARTAGSCTRRSPTPLASGSTPAVGQAASSRTASGVESGVISGGGRGNHPPLFPTTAAPSSSGSGPEVVGKALATNEPSSGMAGANSPAGSPSEFTSSPSSSPAGRDVEGGGLSASVDGGSCGPDLGEDGETIKKKRRTSTGSRPARSAWSAIYPKIPVTPATAASPPLLLTGGGGGSSADACSEDGIHDQDIETPRKRPCLANTSSGPVPPLTSHEAPGAIDDHGVLSTYGAGSKPEKSGDRPVRGNAQVGVIDVASPAVAQIVHATAAGGGESTGLTPKQAKTDIATMPTMTLVVAGSPSPSRAVVTMPETEADRVTASAAIAAVGPAAASTAVSARTPLQSPAGGTSEKDAKSDEKKEATVAAGKANNATWKEGDTVVLRARCGKGMNKPGGVARVVSVFEEGDYGVKMVLGSSRSQRVSADLLFPYHDVADDPESPMSTGRGARLKSLTRSRRSSCGGGGHGGGHRQPDPSTGLIPPSYSSSYDDADEPPASPVTSSAQPTSIGTENTRRSGATAGSEQAKLGDRVRVLYDGTDWYMGTIVGVHDGADVTVRFDDCTTERVTLCAGDAEVCADHALAPTDEKIPQSPSTSSRVGRVGLAGRGSRSSKTIPDGTNATGIVGAGGRISGKFEGFALTEGRARALLDTVPEKLVGLTYQELHRAYGGWWDTVVTEVLFKDEAARADGTGGGGGRVGAEINTRNAVGGEESIHLSLNSRWPVAVMVEQKVPSGASEGNLSIRQKVCVLLAKAKAWDKQRKSTASEEQEEETRRSAAASEPRRSSNEGKKHQPQLQQERPGAGGTSTQQISRGAKETSIEPAPKKGGRDRRQHSRQSPPPPKAGPAVTTTKAKPAGAGAGARAEKPKPLATILGGNSAAAVGGVVREVDAGAVSVKEDEDLAPGNEENAAVTASAKPKVSARKSAAQRRQEEEDLPTCPICSAKFYCSEQPEAVDAHLAACARKAAAAAAAAAQAAAEAQERTQSGTGTLDRAAPAAESGIDGKNRARRRTAKSVQMPSSISSHLTIALSGDDIGSVVAAVEGLSARGQYPSSTMCDRAMQELLKSRCKFRTECLRRLLKSTIEAHPGVWQPLNWGRFEESLQALAVEQDAEALDSHVAAVTVTLHCVEAHRRRGVAKAERAASAKKAAGARSPAAAGKEAGGGYIREVPRSSPPLFWGAGGSVRNGREAVKKCARWAAKTWARRAGSASAPPTLKDAKACLAAARALAESVESFGLASAAIAGMSSNAPTTTETEACSLVAAELETHCGELTGASDSSSKAAAAAAAVAARSREGLMRALAGRSFCAKIARILLENMPNAEEELGAEVERLRVFLAQQAGG